MTTICCGSCTHAAGSFPAALQLFVNKTAFCVVDPPTEREFVAEQDSSRYTKGQVVRAIAHQPVNITTCCPRWEHRPAEKQGKWETGVFEVIDT